MKATLYGLLGRLWQRSRGLRHRGLGLRSSGYRAVESGLCRCSVQNPLLMAWRLGKAVQCVATPEGTTDPLVSVLKAPVVAAAVQTTCFEKHALMVYTHTLNRRTRPGIIAFSFTSTRGLFQVCTQQLLKGFLAKSVKPEGHDQTSKLGVPQSLGQSICQHVHSRQPKHSCI